MPILRMSDPSRSPLGLFVGLFWAFIWEAGIVGLIVASWILVSVLRRR